MALGGRSGFLIDLLTAGAAGKRKEL